MSKYINILTLDIKVQAVRHRKNQIEIDNHNNQYLSYQIHTRATDVNITSVLKSEDH